MAEFVNTDPPDTAGKLIGHASKAKPMDVTAGKLRTHHTVNLAGDAVANGMHAAGTFKNAACASLDDDGQADDSQPIEEGMEHGMRYGGRSMAGHAKRRHAGNTGTGIPSETVPAAPTAGGNSQSMPATPFSNTVGVPPVNGGPATGTTASKPSIRSFGTGCVDSAKKTSTLAGRPSVSGRGIRPSNVLARFSHGKANISGTVSSASNIAKGFTDSAGNVTRLAQLAVHGIRRIAAGTVSAMTGAAGAPLFLLLAGVIAVVTILAALLSWLPGFSATSHGCDDTVRTEIAIPEGAEPWVAKAAESSGLSAEFIAAMMTIESGFRPDVYADDVSGGTWGLLQLNRTEWRKIHPQGSDLTPPEGITDPMIHAELGGQYLKTRLEGVRRLKAANPTAEFSTLDDRSGGPGHRA